jgi:cytoskeletal protein RodZ
VDLYRVERDTKIRVKYLAALEDGDFGDLPGDVYARGFIRNYATYLGLDPDDIEYEWREEAGQSEPLRPVIAGPAPLLMNRRIVFQRSHLVIGLVAVVVLIVATYFGYQLTRYLSYPTLAVQSNGSAVTLPVGTTTYDLKGTATPGTTVLIAWNGQDPHTVTADDSGNWTYQAILQAGPNQFEITAMNLDTNHASQTVSLLVTVLSPTPTPVVPEVAFASPVDGTSVTTGKVTIAGTSTLVSTVTLTQTWLGPPVAPGATMPPTSPSPAPPSATAAAATGSPGPSPTPGPSPVQANTAADGSFSFSVNIAPGRWLLTLSGTSAAGTPTKPVSRTLNVTYKGITVLVQIQGAPSAVFISHDNGTVVDEPMLVQADGWSMTVVGTKNVCVNTTHPAFVYITVNGTAYGPIAGFGGARAYIDTSGVPKNVSSC